MATDHKRAGDSRNGGLCLLSIGNAALAAPYTYFADECPDGGGVRGLSSLYLLEQLMQSVNDKAHNDPPLKPYEYFDMIGGTSTGG